MDPNYLLCFFFFSFFVLCFFANILIPSFTGGKINIALKLTR